jgi:endonuclease YncB( thermonuclease family)
VIEVMDGDTVNVRLHVWIGQELETHVRFAGIDTPELRGKCEKERQMAQAARSEVARLVADGNIILSDIKLEKYAGRVLARVENTQGISIADHLIEKGYARPYSGKKRMGWCS